MKDTTCTIAPICLYVNVIMEVWWSGGAMVLGKLPLPGRPTIWIQ